MTHFYIADQKEREEIEKRFTFHPAKDDQLERYEKLRDEAKQLAMSITQFCPPSRERALAITNLEQAMMWANAGIARNE